MPRLLLCLALAPFVGCKTVPAAPIPDPLPETLDWARPESEETGAFLGLTVRENDMGSLEELAFEPGVRVTEVVDNSPAADAGFAIGDVLLAFDGTQVDDPGTLDALLREHAEGPPVTIEVRRGDSVFELDVPLSARSSPRASEARLVWRSDPARSRAGWLAGHGGVVLVTSDPSAPFPRAGIPVGSVVFEIDGEPVHSERALIRTLQRRPPGTRVEVLWSEGTTVESGSETEQRTRKTRVRLWAPKQRVTNATFPIVIGYKQEVDGSAETFYLIDLWFIWLFKYKREGNERTWTLFRFIRFSRGIGELAE